MVGIKSVEKDNIMSSGLINERDFQIGLSQAWHGQTEIVEKIERRMFPVVERVDLFYEINGQRVEHGDKCLVTMDDCKPVSGSVSDSYAEFYPHKAWDHVMEALSGSDFTVESIGMIYDRSRFFMTIGLDELESITGGSDKEGYKLTISSGLNRNQSPSYNVSHVVAVCANTVQVARQGKALFSEKLTKSFGDKLKVSTDVISNAVGFARTYEENLTKLRRTLVDVDTARELYVGEQAQTGNRYASTQTRNKVDELLVGFQRGRGNNGETMMDVLNGFTEVFGQGLAGSKSKKSKWDRWVSSETGIFANRKSSFADSLFDVDKFDKLRSLGKETMEDYRKQAVTVSMS